MKLQSSMTLVRLWFSQATSTQVLQHPIRTYGTVLVQGSSYEYTALYSYTSSTQCVFLSRLKTFKLMSKLASS